MGVLAFVGLPGSGKSVVGVKVAREVGVDFLDTDQEIERRLGCSIRSFFNSHGEAEFRVIECELIDEVTRFKSLVLATGGGAVLSPRNREILCERTDVVYLHSRPDDLFKRLHRDRTRPLLQVLDPLAKLNELYDYRDPLYREISRVIVETAGQVVSTLVTQTIRQLGISNRTFSPP